MNWKQIIVEWQQSNQSQKKFCEQHSIALSSFQYHRKKLSDKSPGIGFIPVHLENRKEIFSLSISDSGKLSLKIHFEWSL